MKARSGQELILTAQMVYESVGSELSLRKLAQTIGISIETVKSYLEAFESAYLLFSVPFFTYSSRQQTVRNKKYYPVDICLRESIITKTGKDIGKKIETLVFLKLRSKYSQINYWKEKLEVDFVVRDPEHPSGIRAYQVTSFTEVVEQKLTALIDFSKKYKDAELNYLYMGDEKEVETGSGLVVHARSIERFLSE